MSQPRILWQILRLPQTAQYVSRNNYVGSDGRVNLASVPNNSYTYSNRGLDYFFPLRNLPYRIGYRSDRGFDFKSVQKLNEVCGWSYTEEFAPNDPRMNQLISTARSPDAFMLFYIASENEDWASISNFLGGQTQGVAYNVSSDARTYPDSPNASTFAVKGGGGLIMDVNVQAIDSGHFRVTVEGTCWAQTLEETRQAKVDGKQRDQPTDLQTAHRGIWSLFADLLWFNAEYERDIINTLDADGLVSEVLQANDNVVTPIGKWLTQVTLSTSAVQNLRTRYSTNDLDDYYEASGNHSVLESFQRLAESAGLVFHSNLPVILVDVPNTSVKDWRPKHFQTAEMTFHRPRATDIVVTHTDGTPRDWVVHSPITNLQRDYGFIQKSERSVAPIPPDTETAEALGLTGEEGDNEIWRIISDQIAATAVRESATYSAVAEMRWQPGSRYGEDWRLGDSFRLILSDSENPDNTLNPPTTIRQATITQTSDGSLTITAGLGATSDIIPSGGAEVSTIKPIRIG